MLWYFWHLVITTQQNTSCPVAVKRLTYQHAIHGFVYAICVNESSKFLVQVKVSTGKVQPEDVKKAVVQKFSFSSDSVVVVEPM